MKKLFTIFLEFILTTGVTIADEGMWLPFLIKNKIVLHNPSSRGIFYLALYLQLKKLLSLHSIIVVHEKKLLLYFSSYVFVFF